LSEGFHLSIEQRRITEIIPNARHRCAVARQGDRGERPPARAKPADQLARQMAGLRRAAAVAEGDDFSSRSEGVDNSVACRSGSG
jgi:hypothetical protein